MDDHTASMLGVIAAVVLFMLAVCKLCMVAASDATGTDAYEWLSNTQIRHMSIEEFLSQIDVQKKPFRFKWAQIAAFTSSYSAQLGGGRFSTVFKGSLPNGLAVAVKVFKSNLDVNEEQFLAAVGTMWKTRHHVNLVRLLGFCFQNAARVLVYEYVDNGALDAYLLRDDAGLRAPLLDVAVAVAKGIRHLHDECKEKVVHYDIKLGNVLLDGKLNPKVADVGLAQLVNAHTLAILSSLPESTHGRYIAPEIQVQRDITEKCDVYSFGMLLLEIVARKPENGEFFPEQVWIKYETGSLMDLVVMPSREHTVLVIDDDMQKWKELAERMCKVAFWCLQKQPAARPSMGDVVRMLEGEMEIAPPANPFQDVPTALVVTYLRPNMTSTWNTTMTRSGNMATENGVSDAIEVIGSLFDFIQAVTESN